MSSELSADLFEMDALLRRAADGFAYPPSPSLAPGVTARLRRPARYARLRAAARALWAPPLARAAAALALAALAAVGLALALPSTRGALADFFGLSHVRVEIREAYGPPPQVLSPNSYGRPAEVAEAQAAVDFTLRFPTRDGVRLDPDASYVFGEGSAALVVFVYYDEPFDLYQQEGIVFGKGGPDASLIHQITFDGHDALWIDEGEHVAQLYDGHGRLIIESVRTVTRATLLWEEGPVTYRLETTLSQDEAMEVARSLR